MIFADNTQTLAGLADNAGVLASDWRTEGQWGVRSASLSAYAGKAVSSYVLYANQSTPAGSYTIDYADIAILSSDGTVTPVYYRRMGDALPVAYNPSGQTNLAASEVELAASPGSPQTNTTYYASDHLGSARILTVAGGWPVASDAFYPFGAEQTPPPGDNAYKFATLDRDAESQQDHTSFRQYAYIEGRWTTPDPYDGSYDATNPQSFNRYAYVLNNPLKYLDPFGLVLQDIGGGCFQDITSWSITTPGDPDDDDDGDGGGTTTSGTDYGGIVCLENPQSTAMIPYQPILGRSSSAPSKQPTNLDTYLQNYKACLSIGLQTVVDDLNPIGPATLLGAAQDLTTTMAQGALGAAAAHSLESGLTVPLRSSIVRGLLSNWEVLGAAADALVVAAIPLALAHGVYAEATGCF